MDKLEPKYRDFKMGYVPVNLTVDAKASAAFQGKLAQAFEDDDLE